MDTFTHDLCRHSNGQITLVFRMDTKVSSLRRGYNTDTECVISTVSLNNNYITVNILAGSGREASFALYASFIAHRNHILFMMHHLISATIQTSVFHWKTMLNAAPQTSTVAWRSSIFMGMEEQHLPRTGFRCRFRDAGYGRPLHSGSSKTTLWTCKMLNTGHRTHISNLNSIGPLHSEKGWGVYRACAEGVMSREHVHTVGYPT